jgi:hypothetical protein
MARLPDVDPERTDPYAQRVLEAQARHWGASLLNHRIYARRPEIFRAVRGMWTALGAATLIPPILQGLLNRRVALLNRCEF